MYYEYPETLYWAGFPPPSGYFDDTPEAARFREVANGVAEVLGDRPLRACALATVDLNWDIAVPPTPERYQDLLDWYNRLPLSRSGKRPVRLAKHIFFALFGFLPCWRGPDEPPVFQHVWVRREGYEPELDDNDIHLHAAYAFFRLRVGMKTAETKRKSKVRRSAFPVHGVLQ